MKKKYSDPLMFPSLLLTIPIDDNISGQLGPDDAVTETESAKLSVNASSISVAYGSASEAVVGSNDDVQIVEPTPTPEAPITEEGIQSVLDQLLGEENEIVPSDESSIAD